MVRLQKVLADRGVASRRKAEELIEQGVVRVNGHPARLGDKVDDRKDLITVRGKRIAAAEASVYLMLHKPRGFVTTMSDEMGRKCVADLVKDVEVRVYPVGRLDRDSEGLLLMTNDGDFANKLMHPKHEINKTYRVIVTGYTAAALEKLSQPVTLDGHTIAKPTVRLIHGNTNGSAELEVVIHEGRNRQVRRMCDIAGMTVVRLIRIAEGQIRLGNLPLGNWRKLTAQEVDALLG